MQANAYTDNVDQCAEEFGWKHPMPSPEAIKAKTLLLQQVLLQDAWHNLDVNNVEAGQGTNEAKDIDQCVSNKRAIRLDVNECKN